jgi:aspartyl-tRNA(Asn)/glutamyl-tRNA(Gln) amidotransferase subunit B
MPALPDDYRRIFTETGLDPKVASDIIAVPSTAMTVKRVYEAAGASHARRVAFWLLQPQSDDEETAEATEVATNDAALIKLSQMVEDNKLSSTAAKEVLTEVLKTGADPEKVAADKNLLQVSDEGAITEIVKQVLSENAKAAEDVKNGEMKAIGFLVGQVMKLSQGKANPAMATDLIKKQLGL